MPNGAAVMWGQNESLDLDWGQRNKPVNIGSLTRFFFCRVAGQRQDKKFGHLGGNWSRADAHQC